MRLQVAPISENYFVVLENTISWLGCRLAVVGLSLRTKVGRNRTDVVHV